jgi:nucleotide-binding universal stress UspA family protein
MIKRILVVLDGSKFSKAATQLAGRIAQKSKGVVIGVGVLDIPGIERSVGPVPLGGSHFAMESIKRNLQIAEDKLKLFLKEFELECQKNQVKYEVVLRKGDTFKQLLDEGKTADVIIIGLMTYFHFATSDKADSFPNKLLESTVCPVIAVPEQLDCFCNVLIAYDGSLSSSKAMRFYAQLSQGLPRADKVILLNINDDEDQGKQALIKAQQYLNTYDIQAETWVRTGDPSTQIYEAALEIQPGVVVMGVHGNNRIRDFFLGSTVRKIINERNIPFLAAQ